MLGLPDVLEPGLRLVLCGTVPGLASAARGHYYAGPGNAFWGLLFEAGLTPVQVGPEDDATMPRYGIGLTDLVKNHAQSDDRGLAYDVPGFVARMEAVAPEWVAFTSNEAGKAVARALGEKAPGLGQQEWTVAGSRVFVLPSPSGRNQGRGRYDGRGSRLEWWSALRDVMSE